MDHRLGNFAALKVDISEIINFVGSKFSDL